MQHSFFLVFIKTKRTLALILFSIVVLCLVSSCTSKEEPVIEYKDQEFVKDLALGWQERFDCECEAAKEDSAEKQQELLLKGVDAELSYIKNYSNEAFKKQGLKDLMNEYITCINEANEALQYYVSDNDKYLSLIQSVNNNRRRILTRLVSDYGLAVDEEHQAAFSESLSNAKATGVYSKQQETVNALVSGIEFEKKPDDYYGQKYHTYVGNVNNTTGISFEKLDIKIKLYDKDGVVVGTESIYLENFKNESTEKAEFTTDAQFETMEVSCDSWKEAK